MKKNCWEYIQCGREPGGTKSADLGVCPAAIEHRTHTIHGGTNGGRVCWAVAGTFCWGKVQGTYAEKLLDCIHCKFYCKVMDEEGGAYSNNETILKRLQREKST